MELENRRIIYQLKTFPILMVMGLLTAAKAGSHLSKRFQLHQVQQQILHDHQYSIQNITTIDVTACALNCVKDENCSAVSYHDETQECSLSSAYPIVPADGVNSAVILTPVYMKAKESFCLGPRIYFERHHLVLPPVNTAQRPIDPKSIKSCAEECVDTMTCYGFTYLPQNAGCNLLMINPENLVMIETVLSSNLQYLIYREQQNIARDKNASQSSPFGEDTADLAVNGNFHDMTATVYEVQPYWIVDLELSYRVMAVKVYQTSDPWIPNPTVYVGMTADIFNQTDIQQTYLNFNHPVCGHMEGDITDMTFEFICSPSILGRYVFIDSFDSGNHHSLGFAEVEVFGECNSIS